MATIRKTTTKRPSPTAVPLSPGENMLIRFDPEKRRQLDDYLASLPNPKPTLGVLIRVLAFEGLEARLKSKPKR